MQKLILVLGMHRSGTSLVTKALTTLGVYLGDQLMSPAPDNPKGFFEDIELQAINEQFLLSQSCHWDSVRFPSKDTVLSSALDTYHSTIAQHLLTRKWPLWGFKDPRMCRLWPFWETVLSTTGQQTKVVWILRHPFAVARSLARRNQMPWEMSFLLWRLHNIGAIEGLLNWGGGIVLYEKLLAEPEKTILGMANMLDIGRPDKNLLRDFADAFLDYELNHYKGMLAPSTSDHHHHYEDLYQILGDDSVSLRNKLVALQEVPMTEATLVPSLMLMQHERDNIRRNYMELHRACEDSFKEKDTAIRELSRLVNDLKNRAFYLESLILHQRIQPMRR
ncbi:MAG: hypothetical protein PHG39_04890 [Acidithiobacillus ferrooxidans]|nr:hypothetical protein [Acidithiobacillus ferrooxidans]MDD5002623.1 hypothetical protein [Acidithiobacillus sp.]MDD5379144.1 hypothetical protein [Acidithiobacillus sp.]MDD5575519.1 hypothetical protein [Acidithiobacillus sp.]